MPNAFAEIGFKLRVREERQRFGFSGTYDRVLAPERNDGAELTAREADFLTERNGIFQATVSETGWPYVQFQGGAPGFLKVIDGQTVGYADYRGNRQYISTGNLSHDERVSIIAVDYERQKRQKLWSHASIVEDPDVVGFLRDGAHPKAERGIVIRGAAFDWHCPQHIPIRLTEAERRNEIAPLNARIEMLEVQLTATAAAEQRARVLK